MEDAVIESELAIGVSPDGKPVLVVDYLSDRFELRKLVISRLGYGFPDSAHDLEIPVVHPDLPLEVDSPFCGLCLHREDEAVKLIHTLLALVRHVIFGEVLGRKRKGLQIVDHLGVFTRPVESP